MLKKLLIRSIIFLKEIILDISENHLETVRKNLKNSYKNKETIPYEVTKRETLVEDSYGLEYLDAPLIVNLLYLKCFYSLR